MSNRLTRIYACTVSVNNTRVTKLRPHYLRTNLVRQADLARVCFRLISVLVHRISALK